MGKIIEYTLVSVDGVYTDPAGLGFMRFRDDAYLRDGLGVLSACEAMIMGRGFYESSVKFVAIAAGSSLGSQAQHDGEVRVLVHADDDRVGQLDDRGR